MDWNQAPSKPESVDRKKSALKDNDFDIIIGHIEDLLIDESFSKLQQSFLEKYWQYFDDDEENKLCYTAFFLDYTNSIEEYITNYLEKKILNFSINKFVLEMSRRRQELDGEAFEMLYSLTDFEAFKEMMLDYRKIKLSGEIDLSSTLNVTSMPIKSSNVTTHDYNMS